MDALRNFEPMVLILSVPGAVLGWLTELFLAGRETRQAQILRATDYHRPIVAAPRLVSVCLSGGGIKRSKEVGDSCPVLAKELEQRLTTLRCSAKSAILRLGPDG